MKLDVLISALLDKFSSLPSAARSSMSEARMSNHSFPAPLEVPVPQPSPGQDPTFCTPESIVGSHREFQGEGMDWVLSGYCTPFPYVQSEFTSVREDSGLGSGSAQAPMVGEAGPAEVRKTTRVSFRIPSSSSSADPDTEDEDRDSLDSSSPG